ncbi:hypothetical protein [Ottowia thiooxydans]|uniref:Uncharacterized protein n=1 Tax=Ottowia thiooxydans TaxID=219182 RepID=A0ABV2Q6G5_9BURK
MEMIKTAKGREALTDRASMSMSERRILILCDGKRSRQEIVSWLGKGALLVMDSLFEQGYLAIARSVPPSRPAVAAEVHMVAADSAPEQTGAPLSQFS